MITASVNQCCQNKRGCIAIASVIFCNMREGCAAQFIDNVILDHTYIGIVGIISHKINTRQFVQPIVLIRIISAKASVDTGRYTVIRCFDRYRHITDPVINPAVLALIILAPVILPVWSGHLMPVRLIHHLEACRTAVCIHLGNVIHQILNGTKLISLDILIIRSFQYRTLYHRRTGMNSVVKISSIVIHIRREIAHPYLAAADSAAAVNQTGSAAGIGTKPYDIPVEIVFITPFNIFVYNSPVIFTGICRLKIFPFKNNTDTLISERSCFLKQIFRHRNLFFIRFSTSNIMLHTTVLYVYIRQRLSVCCQISSVTVKYKFCPQNHICFYGHIKRLGF